MAYHLVAALDDLWIGEMRACVIDGKKVLVLRIADGVRAYEDRCAHLGFPLSQGQLEDDVITCSAHHYQYDALTGQGVNPRTACLTTFAVKVEAGKVFVDATQAKRPGDAG